MYNDYKEVVTVEELADIFKMGLRTTYRLIHEGEIVVFPIDPIELREKKLLQILLLKISRRRVDYL